MTVRTRTGDSFASDWLGVTPSLLDMWKDCSASCEGYVQNLVLQIRGTQQWETYEHAAHSTTVFPT